MIYWFSYLWRKTGAFYCFDANIPEGVCRVVNKGYDRQLEIGVRDKWK